MTKLAPAACQTELTAALHGVIAVTAINRVAAFAAEQFVIAPVAVKPVGNSIACDSIVAAPGINAFDVALMSRPSPPSILGAQISLTDSSVQSALLNVQFRSRQTQPYAALRLSVQSSALPLTAELEARIARNGLSQIRADLRLPLGRPTKPNPVNP